MVRDNRHDSAGYLFGAIHARKVGAAITHAESEAMSEPSRSAEDGCGAHAVLVCDGPWHQ